MSSPPGHALPWSGRQRVVTFLIGTGLALLASVSSGAGAFRGVVTDPDTAMRLLRLQDSLQAGHVIHAVWRDNAGNGTILHWSHLLDGLILLIAAPVAAVGGWPAGLAWVTIIFGPMSVGLLAVAVAWAVLPVAQSTPLETGGGSSAPVWLAAVALGLSPAVVQYGLVGVVHHHVLLAVTSACGAGWAIRAVRGGGTIAGAGIGISAALGLWLSPEALAFGLMALGAVWVAWLADPRADLARAVATAGSALFAVTAVAWLLDPPAIGYQAAEPDRLSVMFVWLAAGAAVSSALALRDTWARPIAVLFGFGTAAAWLTVFPQVLRGTAGLMDPAQARAFFDGILEMSPVRDGAGVATHLLRGGMAALFLAWLACYVRVSAALYAAACGVVMVVLASQHVRFAAYPATFAAGVLPIAVARAMRSGLSDHAVARVRIAIIGVFLALPAFAGYGLAGYSSVAVATTGGAAASGLDTQICSLDDAVALTLPLGSSVVLAPVNEGPILLWRTRVRTVGSLYHRGIDGFMRLQRAWYDPADPQTAVTATKAEYILFCAQPGLAAPDHSLAAQLNGHQTPAWLDQAASSGGYVLYRVRP